MSLREQRYLIDGAISAPGRVSTGAMRRRLLAAMVLVLVPGRAPAQHALRRVVYVASPGWFAYRDSPSLRERQREYNAALFAKEGLAVGRDLVLEDAFADSPREEDVDRLARQVVASGPALVLVAGECIRDFMRHTRRIPLVFFNLAEDPVSLGVVESYARPGTNATGTTLKLPGEAPKAWELLKALSPRAKRLGLLCYPEEPSDPDYASAREAAAPLAAKLDLALVDVVIPRKVSLAAFERAVKAARVDLLDATGINDEAALPEILRYLERMRLPASWLHTEFVKRGGLLSSEPSRGEGFTDAVRMAAAILRGDSPSALPVRLPRRYVTAINMGTARTMGLAIPPSVLLRADLVVE